MDKYEALNDTQKDLFGRLSLELDEFEQDLSLKEVKEVYEALLESCK